MKKIINMSFAALALTFASWSFAGEGSSCHFHGSKKAKESTIEQCANQRRDLYLKNGTIDASWSDVKPSVIELVDGAKRKEWRVRFDNPQASDSTKDQLFMFFTLPGNFIAANYSGK